MGGHRHDIKARVKHTNGSWHDVLNFGQEKVPTPQKDTGVQDRLKKLVKQLEDLNRRMDRLNQTDRY